MRCNINRKFVRSGCTPYSGSFTIMSMNETAQVENVNWNRQVYQRLKLALSLGLRRQILFAVCDNLNLRNRIAARLHSNLAYPVAKVLYQRSHVGELSTPAYPRLVTLRLNINDPNPIAQINQWLANYPPPLVGKSPDNPGKPLPIPAFQIVGVEMLTKQSVGGQHLFLDHLRLNEQYLFSEESNNFLESSLLFWVSRPWLYAIQQSAPKFWHCRNGVFIFAGEPTPTVDNRHHPVGFNHQDNVELTNYSTLPIKQDHAADFPEVNYQNYPVNINDAVDDSAKNNLVEIITEKTEKSDNLTHQGFPFLSVVNPELQELIRSALSNPGETNPQENYEIQNLLREIEQLHCEQAPGEKLAIAYQNLGNLYRTRIESGSVNLENLMVAILAYQEAVSHDENSPQLPDILNDLGTLYWMLHRIPNNSQEAQMYLEQAIDFYKLALKLVSSDIQPDIYGRVQNNLGTAYGDLSKFCEHKENWQLAVIAYHESLHYRDETREPLKYAACQNNLGTAYWHLAQYHEPLENLKKAIAAYKLAVNYYQPSEEPFKYGMIQNNIGTAYWNMSQYEEPMINLQLAIEIYQEALLYRTADSSPHGYAATQNNLGIAYWHLANLPETSKEDKEKFILCCIDAYQKTLEIADTHGNLPLSFNIWMTYNNLGLAHYYLVTDKYFQGDKNTVSQHLEMALENYLKALTGFTPKTENYETTINYIITTVRTFHNKLGIHGQNLALSKLPGNLIPEVLPKL